MRNFDLLARKEITTVREFLEDLEAVRVESERDGRGHTWYFRGDRAEKRLVPSIGEVVRYCGKELLLDEFQEKALLDRFRRAAYQELNRVPTDWEALFLSRHYGLPARILDWSANPLVALYFSCSPLSSRTEPGVVWGLLRNRDERSDINIFERENPFEVLDRSLDAVKLIHPIYNSQRITAQKGIFTWHSHPGKPLDSYGNKEFQDEALDISRLVRWPVNTNNRLGIVQDLERLGVTQRTIFPDLSGIATGLWQSIVLWHGKKIMA